MKNSRLQYFLPPITDKLRFNSFVKYEKIQFSTFTMVELLVVISVIAMLAAMMLPALSKTMDRARSSQCVNNRHQYELAEHMYKSAWGETPSNDLEVFLNDKYLKSKKLPECPSQGVYLWIGERGRDLAPKMGCSIHYYPVDSDSLSDDDNSDGDAGEDDGNTGGNGGNGGGGWWGAIDPFSTIIFILFMAIIVLPSFHDPRKSHDPMR
jgi:type II secretory pathway pseudopilin PulG